MNISSDGQILLILQGLKASGPAPAGHCERVRVLDISSRREIAALHPKGSGLTSVAPGIASGPFETVKGLSSGGAWLLLLGLAARV